MNTPCPCFICSKQINYLEEDKTLTLLDGAVEVELIGSYGSIYDITKMLIWICDECIEERESKTFMVNADLLDDYTMENDNE